MINLKFSKYFLILSVIILCLPAIIVAQESKSADVLNRAAQYFLGKEGEVLIKVNILGYVQRPGQYLIPRHTDLISLIAFAGGSRDGANLSNVRIIRTGNLEQGANGQNNNKENIETISVNVKKYFDKAKAAQIPTLEGGDIVLISQSFGNKFRHFIGITSVVGLIAVTATIVLAIDRL